MCLLREAESVWQRDPRLTSNVCTHRSHTSRSGAWQITTRSSDSRPSRRKAHSQSRQQADQEALQQDNKRLGVNKCRKYPAPDFCDEYLDFR